MGKVLLAVGAAIVGLFIIGHYAPAKSEGIPIPQSELQRLWGRAMQAEDARQLRAMAPPSWGPLPWTFQGPVRFDNPAREETVKIKVYAINDSCVARVAWINIEYQVFASPGNSVVRTATHRINKGLCA